MAAESDGLDKAVTRVDAAAEEMREALAELQDASAKLGVTLTEQRAALAAHNRARRSVA